MEEKIKRTFKIYTFDKNTLEVQVTATCKTKAITEDSLRAVINKEVLGKPSCCYEITVGRPEGWNKQKPSST